ncbi:MAG: hypothetical protein QF473_18665, partial [Planctomycetota bacterium]|nr:hypothetical protein [Planctomycetota bacterium]
MNIERISCSAVHVNHRGNWLFVHLDTDEGLRGLGEFSHSHKESEAVAYLDELSGRLCNSDPSDIKTLCRELRSDASRPLHYTVI